MPSPAAPEGMPARAATRVEVVICTYTQHREELLAACIEAALGGLPRTDPAASDRVTVVVDGAPQLAQRLSERHGAEPRLRVLENTRTRGLSGARNTAVAASTADALLFVDDDAVLQPGWYEALQARLADPGTAIVAGGVTPEWERGAAPTWFPPEFRWVVGCDYEGMPPSGAAVRNPIGACMAIRREVFERIGLFAEGLGRIGTHPVGGEETDLGIRLRAQLPASRVVRDTRMAVRHFVPAVRSRVGYALRRCFWEGRSKALLAARAATLGSLGTERAHILTVVKDAALVDARRALRGGLAAARRNLVRVACLGAAAIGFATAPRRHRRQAVLEGAPRLGVDVSVCISTLGRSPMLPDTVTAVLAQTARPMEVVVVDNDPRSGRVAAALAGLDDARLRIVAEPRRGLSAARNRGIAAARGPVLVFTDDDARPEPGWLETLLAGFSDPEVACVTGRVLAESIDSDPERWFEEGVGFDKGATRAEWGRRGAPLADWPTGPEGPVYPIAAGEFGSGNSMAFRRAFLIEQGGFAETLGAGSMTRGGEDLDMFRRVVLAGRVLRYEPAAVVMHRHRDTEEALRSQLFGYGTGMAANVTRLAATSPRHLLAVLGALPAGFRMLLDGDSSKNRGRPRDYPSRLVWTERVGYAVGPLLYLAEVARLALRLPWRRGDRAHA